MVEERNERWEYTRARGQRYTYDVNLTVLPRIWSAGYFYADGIVSRAGVECGRWNDLLLEAADIDQALTIAKGRVTLAIESLNGVSE